MKNVDGNPVTQLNLIHFIKNVFVYEIGLIAICEVLPPFDEEQRMEGHTSLSTALVTTPSYS